MPYKDKEKQKEAKRKSAAKRRAAVKKGQEVEDVSKLGTLDMGDRPTVEDAEAAYGNENNEAQLESRVTRNFSKSRTWACIMYQDSAPADWEDRLRQIGVSAAVSPLHDKDLTSTGQLKKAHWHVILDWPHGSTTYATAVGVTRGVLKGTIPIPLVSPRGYYRYFCHLDNPTKAQYDVKDIIHIGGFDVGDFIELTSQEKLELRKKLMEVIIKDGITEYYALVVYAQYNMSNAEFDFVCQNTMFFNTVLRSKHHMENPPEMRFSPRRGV